MNLTLNGKTQDVGDISDVSSLLTSLGFGEIPVLVELNGKALFPREYPDTTLEDGDKLEIIRVVAGG